MIGAVITVGPDRHDNLRLALKYLAQAREQPRIVVLVYDGPEAEASIEHPNLSVADITLPRKHEPGMEQPRNVGVRVLQKYYPEITHAWFLDSDVLVDPEALTTYYEAIASLGDDTILIGPYEWMPMGVRQPMPELCSDFRWPMFRERGVGPFVADLGVALGCFGGNLVWPIEAFTAVGGFHPQLHHGRAEDGELGLRAASHRIPMALVAAARGYHVEHARNHERTLEQNRRDVPLINRWHPWVEGRGLIVTEQDGARFDFTCSCGARMNTLLMWEHMHNHRVPDLILPDGLR